MEHLIQNCKGTSGKLKGLYRGTNCVTRVAVPTPPCSGHTLLLNLLIHLLLLLLILLIHLHLLLLILLLVIIIILILLDHILLLKVNAQGPEMGIAAPARSGLA